MPLNMYCRRDCSTALAVTERIAIIEALQALRKFLPNQAEKGPAKPDDANKDIA
jgi:hypothetical protein